MPVPQSETGAAPPRPTQSRGRSGTAFIEHTLHNIAGTLEQSLFAEETARRPGLLQSLDPRVKVITLLALLISVSLSRSLPVLALLYAVALLLAVASKLPLGFFVKRVWLFLPFFTGIIALPAFFMTPGPPLVYLPLGLVITRTGALTAMFLLMRVSTSVSFSILLVLTTPWATLLKAMSVLRIPDVIIVIFGMTYRYIFLLLNTLNDMFLSRKSRVVGRLGGAEQRRLVGATAGTVLGKSLHLSTEVYLAMQARGYRGHPRTMDTFKMQPRDWVYGGLIMLVALVMTWLGR